MHQVGLCVASFSCDHHLFGRLSWVCLFLLICPKRRTNVVLRKKEGRERRGTHREEQDTRCTQQYLFLSLFSIRRSLERAMNYICLLLSFLCGVLAFIFFLLCFVMLLFVRTDSSSSLQNPLLAAFSWIRSHIRMLQVKVTRLQILKHLPLNRLKNRQQKMRHQHNMNHFTRSSMVLGMKESSLFLWSSGSLIGITSKLRSAIMESVPLPTSLAQTAVNWHARKSGQWLAGFSFPFPSLYASACILHCISLFILFFSLSFPSCFCFLQGQCLGY